MVEDRNVISLIRFKEYPQQTNGKGFVIGPDLSIKMEFCTMELPWRENQRRISRIPPGCYRLEKRYSPRYEWHFHVMDVEDRSLILIHQGNFHYQTEGCILPGRDFADINGDDLPDVVASRNTMQQLLDLMPADSFIIISDHFELEDAAN